MSCYQVMQALKDCQKKHPKESNGAVDDWLIVDKTRSCKCLWSDCFTGTIS